MYSDGRSFLPVLLGEKQDRQDRPLIWAFPEYGGQIALRMGNYKLIRRGLNDPEQNPEPELYNLGEDSLETRNLARERPAIRDSLQALFFREYTVPDISRFQLRELEAERSPE
jgi:arylsulfatase